MAAYGLLNLVVQFDQLAPLLIQMSGVRLEQRKQDLIGHGEVMPKAIHLAPARISYEIRETTFIKRTMRHASDVGRQRNGKRAVWH